jgi:hypothetical protein
MVKKLVIFILLLAAIIYISYLPEHVNASSYAEIIIGNPPEDAGEHIAYSYGFQILFASNIFNEIPVSMNCTIFFTEFLEFFYWF